MDSADATFCRHKPLRIAHVVTIYRGVVGILEPKLVALDSCDDLEICCITAPKPEDLDLPESRIRQISCPMDRQIRPLRDLPSIQGMARIFARENFDIVHSHSAKAGMIAALARRISPVPFLVHTYHGLPFFDGQARVAYGLYRSFELIACRHRDFCFSQNLRDIPTIMSLMGSSGRVAYEGNGVDIGEVDRRARDTLASATSCFPDGSLRIALVSRLEPVKKVDDFLRVMQRIVEWGYDAVAVIAGYGPDRADLEGLSSRLGLRERVRFLGWYPDVPGLLAASDIVMLTSQKEGIPRALIEAMALARPIVATDVLGTQELVDDGRTGFLCPYENVDELASRTALLADDAEQRRVFGERGRQRVNDHFNDRKIAARLAEFYRKVAAGDRGNLLTEGFPVPETAIIGRG